MLSGFVVRECCCSLQKDVIERLDVSSSHLLRSSDHDGNVADRIDNAGNSSRAGIHDVNMDVVPIRLHLSNVNHALHRDDDFRVLLVAGRVRK